MLHLIRSAATADSAAYVAATYRGTAAGWQPTGPARTAADAERMVALLQRIRPTYVAKVRPA